MYLLGIDIGTTCAKAMVFDENGVPKGYAVQEYPVLCPRPGYAEQDAEKVWEYTKEVIRRAAEGCASPIGALSLSVQGDAVIAINENHHAISPAYLGMDYRGEEETRECISRFGSAPLFERTGMRPHPMNSVIKILWIKNHEPALFDRACRFVTYSDFILGKLGSEQLVIDHTMAGRTMAFNAVTQDWDGALLKILGIPKDKLSLPVPSGRIVGTISPSVAGELGLPRDVRLVTGGHDQTCAALGAGIITEHTALDSHGTAEVLSVVFEHRRLNSAMYAGYYPCYPYLLPGKYFSFALNHTAGILFKWFVDNFCREDQLEAEKRQRQIYDYITEQFNSTRPSPLMALPHFNGSGTPTCDLGSRGAILGLTMASTRSDVAQAILESLSFELKINITAMKNAGISISRLRAAGGGAKSAFILQNKANILGLPVSTLKVREAACLGAALTAGLAVGSFHTPDEAVSIISLEHTYEPVPAVRRLYEEKYNTYSQMYDIIRELSYVL